MDQPLWKQMRAVTATEEGWYDHPGDYGAMLMVIADAMDASWPRRGGGTWTPTEWLREQARAAMITEINQTGPSVNAGMC